MGTRLFASHKSGENVELQIVPRGFMIFQKSDTVMEREIGRQEVFKEIDFGMQEILKGGAVRDDMIQSAACVLDRQQVCNL
jgi:hypothetical protein